MCTAEKNGTVEAYKNVIEFNKTIISISSTILAALIAFIVYQQIEFRILNYLSLALLVISIGLSIFGFGRAIETVKDGTSRAYTILLTNLGSGFLILGILAILLVKDGAPSVDKVLQTVEKSATMFRTNFSAKNCQSIDFVGGYYILRYKNDSSVTEVRFSVDKNRIISIK
jgi:hypothetical protein